jgi:hypothetical protein
MPEAHSRDAINKRRRARIAAGFCSSCGKQRGDSRSKVYCNECRAVRSDTATLLRAGRRRDKLCPQCGGRRDRGERFMLCQKCAQRSVLRDLKRRTRFAASGLCRECGKEPLAEGSTWRGEKCLARHKNGR